MFEQSSLPGVQFPYFIAFVEHVNSPYISKNTYARYRLINRHEQCQTGQ